MVSSNLAPPNGQELLSEFMQYGRQGPFEEIVRRYAGMVFNVCLRVTKDKHDAEDATQAVFLTLAIQARRGAEVKALGPWLQQVAKRLSLDLRRSKSRRKVREERHQVENVQRHNGNGDSLPQADLDEIKVILHEELNKLPSKYRLPLILHYFGGMSRDEMASELGCKPSTLGVRIFRGREMLAGRLNGRGINMSSGTFTVALAYTVRSVVSHAMVSTTSHAASALAVGHDGIGLVSARVIGLSRRAAGAMMLGKFKLATAVLILTGMSLGAGAKAFGMLPRIDIGRIITDEVRRLIQPLAQPLMSPLRVDAGPVGGSTDNQVAVQPSTPSHNIVMRAWPVSNTSGGAVATLAEVPSVGGSQASAAPYITNFGPSAQSKVHLEPTPSSPTDAGNATAAAHTDGETQNAMAGASGGSHNGGAGDAPMTARPSAALASKAAPAFAFDGMPVLTGAAATDLFVAPSPKHATATAKPTVTGAPASADAQTSGSTSAAASVPSVAAAMATASAAPAVQIVRVPAVGGSVINSNGILSGYGKLNLTGTLDVCGQVVADGQGIDRTLNLTSFQSIRDSAGSPATGPAGWYAQDHGRLTLGMHASTDGASLNWGEDPADPTLEMVNAVRMTDVQTAGGKLPIELSLLATDRQDLPSLAGLTGVPIGLWQVDPSIGEITSADLMVRYDDGAIAALADDESDVELWERTDGTWQSLAAAETLDTSDHLVSALASDFDYFAVSVPTGNGADLSDLIAVPSGLIAMDSNSVPEPVGIGAIAVMAGLLARRRRRH